MSSLPGSRATYRCPACRKTFVFWRPAAVRGVKVKCYFCRTEFDDDASCREPTAAVPAAESEPRSGS
jgi:hypothetical protein